MKATELRIGNLIFDEENEIGIITKIDSENKFIYKDEELIGSVSLDYGDWRGSNGKWISRCKPIPLTEEWLLKLGFKRSREDMFKDFYTLEILKYLKLEFNINNNKCWMNNVELSSIKSVHQIQNLFHALTGQEIKIK